MRFISRKRVNRYWADKLMDDIKKTKTKDIKIFKVDKKGEERFNIMVKRK